MKRELNYLFTNQKTNLENTLERIPRAYALQMTLLKKVNMFYRRSSREMTIDTNDDDDDNDDSHDGIDFADDVRMFLYIRDMGQELTYAHTYIWGNK